MNEKKSVGGNPLKKTRLIFFLTTLSITVLIVAGFCAAILVTSYAQSKERQKGRQGGDGRPPQEVAQNGARPEDFDKLEGEMFNGLLLTTLLSGAAVIIAFGGFAWLLSYIAIKPASESLKRQKLFISNASHELKTPLAVIKADLALVKSAMESGDIKGARMWLDGIDAQVNLAGGTIAALSKITSLDENKRAATAGRVDISAAARLAALSFEGVAFERGKKLEIDIDEAAVGEGYPKEDVAEVITILLDNAVKYASKGIKVRLKRLTGGALLEVSNDGSAIKEDEVDKIFERFFRGESARAQTEGSGLGLSILAGLAEKNGWEIKVKTERENISFSIFF